jgi:hypothetical protein
MNSIMQIIERKNEIGWKPIHYFIKMKKSLYVKKTHSKLFDNDDKFFCIIRTGSFYSENNKVYTWTKRSTLFQNTDFYIYGNPWPSYDF